MKILKRLLIVFVILTAILASIYVFYLRPRYVVPILMYHSISDVEGSSLYVSPENFSRQMDFLDKSGYNVISLGDLVEGIKSGKKFNPGTVVITFDDGYKNNYLDAFPVLAKYDMPATIFIITNYVDTKPDYVTWDQVRLMMSKGISFGGHTRNDVYLPSVKDQKSLVNEVAGPKKDIESKTSGKAEYFCYPTGGFNDNVKIAVKEAGYKGACSTNRGTDRFNVDVYELTRVKVKNSDMTKPFHFRAKLSGYYNLFRSLKNPE